MYAFKIGKGDSGCTAIKCYEFDEDYISQNSTSYWCVDPITNIDFIIMKDTDEGRTLKFLIEDNKKDEVKDYLFKTVLKYISPEKMKVIINNIKHESFRKGWKKKEEQIRHVLKLIVGEF